MKRKQLNGYWIVYVPEHDGCMKSKNYRGWEYEHRYLIEKKLGRLLSKDEIVHHINGDKLDNRLDNLLLMSIDEHSRLHRRESARVHHYCCVCGCEISRWRRYCSVHKRETPLSDVSTDEIFESFCECGFEGTGRKYGVTGAAIKKRLLRDGLTQQMLRDNRQK